MKAIVLMKYGKPIGVYKNSKRVRDRVKFELFQARISYGKDKVQLKKVKGHRSWELVISGEPGIHYWTREFEYDRTN